MIRTIRRAIKRKSRNAGFRSLYSEYKAAQERKKQEPLPYRQWREAMTKNSLTKDEVKS